MKLSNTSRKIVPIVVATMVLIMPVVVLAAGPYTGLVQCDGVTDGKNGRVKCDFVALINQIKFLINWLFYISIPLVLGLFTWAGFLYMSATEKNKTQAKSIFTNALVGFIIMLVAWFLVHTIVSLLAKEGSGFETLLGK